MPSEGFEIPIPAKQAAAHLHFRNRGHWNRLEAMNNTERVKDLQCIVLCEILIGGTHTYVNKNAQEIIETCIKVSQSQIWISNRNCFL